MREIYLCVVRMKVQLKHTRSEGRVVADLLRILRNRNLRSMVLILAAVLLMSQGSLAQSLNMTGLNLLENLRRAADEAITRAGGEANGVVNNAAYRANLLAYNTHLYIGSDLNKTFSQMDRAQRVLFTEVERSTIELNRLTAQIYDIRDATAVDLSSLLATIPFVRIPDFFVQSVRNISFLPRPGEYRFRITALGIGNTSELESKIRLRIDGTDVPIRTMITAGQAEIFIANEELKRFFAEDKLVSLKVEIVVDVKRQHWYGSKESSYVVPVWLNLFPRRAASVTLTWHYPTFGWAPAANPVRNSETKSVSSASAVPFEVVVAGAPAGPPLPGAQRLRECRHICTPDFGTCQYGSSTQQYINNNTTFQTSISTTSVARNWYITCQIDECGQSEVAIGSVKLSLNYDEQPQISIPHDTVLVVANVTSFTGQIYSLQLPGLDRIGTIRQISRVPGLPNQDIFTLEATRPVDVQ